MLLSATAEALREKRKLLNGLKLAWVFVPACFFAGQKGIIPKTVSFLY